MAWKCTWCGKYLGQRESPEDELIIGGACGTCLQRFERELEVYGSEKDRGGSETIIKPPRLLGTIWGRGQGSDSRYSLFFEE
jgi:hypothetical protein